MWSEKNRPPSSEGVDHLIHRHLWIRDGRSHLPKIKCVMKITGESRDNFFPPGLKVVKLPQVLYANNMFTHQSWDYKPIRYVCWKFSVEGSWPFMKNTLIQEESEAWESQNHTSFWRNWSSFHFALGTQMKTDFISLLRGLLVKEFWRTL